MEHNKDKVSHFCVVHFLKAPFEGIDYYVCVPSTWVIRRSYAIVVVAYPNDENPSVIKKRAKKREMYSIDWEFGKAELKHECDTYKNAELWISRNNNRRLSNTNGSTGPWDQELRTGNQKYPKKSDDKSKRTKPYGMPKKRFLKGMESYNEARNRLNLKRKNWRTDTAKSTAQKADLQPVSSTESTIRDESQAPVYINILPKNDRQNPTKLALQQQMVEQYATVCSQVTTTLHNTANVFDNLRNLLLGTAKSYQTFFDNESINASENSANHVSFSGNVTEEVAPVVEDRPNSAPERRNCSNGNQDNGVNKAPKRTLEEIVQHLLSKRRFVLPPEYDPDDTKWTLKYRNRIPGLFELLPDSKIYVKYSKLECCKEASNSCESLAQMMLHEVFNEKALGVCALTTEVRKIAYKTNPDVRPPLDSHGYIILLKYIIQYGVNIGWSNDVEKILNTLDQEVKDMRFK